ncbi:TIGR04452 family lipoprotein [Leptospira neocaledonica]|uniref:Lipoprotein n=1 Tax=Leptospira neocaledonica TaxID=2023192 RepID=A0A2N0A2C3_9LEPT|nr:TIGR04452 family lipoprotein [Leptospira neocaledonica]PJZ78467.1 hypothetical protein CH365_03930 [Leptospira neocaledonica]
MKIITPKIYNILKFKGSIILIFSILLNACTYSGGPGTISGGDAQKKIKDAFQNVSYLGAGPDVPVDCASYGYADRASGNGTFSQNTSIGLTLINVIYINPYLKAHLDQGTYYTESSINQCVDFVKGPYVVYVLQYSDEWRIYAECEVPDAPAFLGTGLFYNECVPEKAGLAETITGSL